jgi:hypothetical protein
LGVLMLETAFARPPGDVGNPASWAIPVLFATIAGATARRVVAGGAADMVEAFVAAGDLLAAQGAVGLITSCGFLATLQPELAQRCRVPVATSSLLQIPLLQSCLRGRVGVITYDAAALTEAHFRAVGADPTTPVAGLPPDGAFHAMIERAGPYDAAVLAEEAVGLALGLQSRHTDLAAIVLECTNLPPFSKAIHVATGLPVFDVLSLGHWFHAGLIARSTPRHV